MANAEPDASGWGQVNKKRLIDANALKGDFMFLRKMWSGTEITAAIDEAPTVDAVEVVHGRWEQLTLGAICRCCNNWNNRSSNYCPNCGAKMDGDKDSNLLFADMEEIIDA